MGRQGIEGGTSWVISTKFLSWRGNTLWTWGMGWLCKCATGENPQMLMGEKARCAGSSVQEGCSQFSYGHQSTKTLQAAAAAAATAYLHL